MQHNQGQEQVQLWSRTTISPSIALNKHQIDYSNKFTFSVHKRLAKIQCNSEAMQWFTPWDIVGFSFFDLHHNAFLPASSKSAGGNITRNCSTYAASNITPNVTSCPSSHCPSTIRHHRLSHRCCDSTCSRSSTCRRFDSSSAGSSISIRPSSRSCDSTCCRSPLAFSMFSLSDGRPNLPRFRWIRVHCFEARKAKHGDEASQTAQSICQTGYWYVWTGGFIRIGARRCEDHVT